MDAASEAPGARLRRFRASGDLAAAAQVFKQLFPAETGGDPVASIKTAEIPPFDPAGDGAPSAKPVPAREGATPVFVTPEREKNPSADICRVSGGNWAIFSAAEQWAGGEPGTIRVRKSSDQGRTWPATLVIGAGRPLTRPSIRQVSDDAIGLVFATEWDFGDGDVHFARIGADMTSSAGTPVALSRADQRNPSLTTDRRAYASPYVYVAYGERDGPVGSIKLRVSPDLGESWSGGVTIDSFPCGDRAEIETAIAYDPDRDALHVAYTRPRGPSAVIVAATSTDFGASWSKPAVLAPVGLPAESSLAIAAGRGTVIVVYERAAGQSDRDIGFSYSRDSGRRWSKGLSLASEAALERAPDIRVSEADGGPAFFASYVEGSGRVRVLSAAGSAPASWTTEGTFPDGAGAFSIGTAVVLPVPGPDGGPSAGALWADTTADGDIYFSSGTVRIAAAVLAVSPIDSFLSSGPVGGPFTPSSLTYTLQNTGDETMDWRVTRLRTWTTVSPTTGTLLAGSSTTVTVSINYRADSFAPGTYTDTVTFTNLDGGSGNTTRGVSLTVVAAGALSVTPAEGLASEGFVGGPFSPSSQTYTLRNTGGWPIDWTAARTQAWTALSAVSGTLDAGGSTTVTVSIGPEADTFEAGTYKDTVAFTDATNDTESETRDVTLTISAPPGVLAVTPAGGFDSAGVEGGPFTPSSQTYTLENTGGAAIDWTAAKTRTWTSLSATSGTLAAGDSTAVTVSINAAANALASGSYGDTVTFTNTDGQGTTTRSVTLTISQRAVLSVTPSSRDVGALAGTTTFAVSNQGGDVMPWTAAVVAGGDWLTIASGASGTDDGVITVDHAANRTASTRVGIVRVTAPGAAGSPRDVTVSQAKGSISIGLTAQRLVEKAWLIQKEFGRLTVTVDNPAAVPVDRYVIYRGSGGSADQVLATIAASTITGSPWTYNDTFLEPGTTYAYRVVALDVYGAVISESNTVTIEAVS
jgi:hypothetical protein